MDKTTLSVDIGNLIKVAYIKKEALEAFKEAVNLVRDIYDIDRREAFSVLAIMQSVIVGYTVDDGSDDPTLKDIIAEAEDMLSKYAKGKSEGKNEWNNNRCSD